MGSDKKAEVLIPVDLPSEKAVLGAAIADSKAAAAVQWLAPDEFYGNQEQIAWAGVLDCLSRGAEPDVLLVAEYMKLHQASAPLTYLAALTEQLPNVANVRYYAERVRKAWQRRRMIQVGSQLAERARKEADAGPLVERATAELLALVDWQADHETGEAAAIVDRVIQDGWRRKKEGSAPPGLRWGWPSVDERMRPLRAGRLYTIGAGTGVGKTSFALQLASNVARAGGSVMFCPLEMNVEDVAAKLMAQRCSVSATQVEDWTLSDGDASSVILEMDVLKEQRLLLDGFRALTLQNLRTRAIQRKRNVGLDLLIVDYLQLMLSSGKTENRANEVAALSRGLKMLAGELKIPVVMCSQLSRGWEERKEKDVNARPCLRDLAESSAIEKDSDAVILLDRLTAPSLTAPIGADRTTTVFVAKQRHWKTGFTRLDFNGAFTRFDELPTVEVGRDRQGGD